MKLIKLNKDHYIVIDNSKIKVGDWYYFEGLHKLNASIHTLKVSDNLGRGCFKITYSTKALEGMRRLEPYISYKYLPLADAEEAINGYSVEDMVEQEYFIERKGSMWMPTTHDCIQANKQEGSIAGFNAAMELTKDKLFTVEDMINAFKEGTNSGALYEDVNEEDIEEFSKTEFEEFKKSIIPKTEWNVEFNKHGKLKLI